MANNEHFLVINGRYDRGLDLVAEFLNLYRYGTIDVPEYFGDHIRENRMDNIVSIPVFQITSIEIKDYIVGLPSICRRRVEIEIDVIPLGSFGEAYLEKHRSRSGYACVRYDDFTHSSFVSSFNVDQLF